MISEFFPLRIHKDTYDVSKRQRQLSRLRREHGREMDDDDENLAISDDDDDDGSSTLRQMMATKGAKLTRHVSLRE